MAKIREKNKKFEEKKRERKTSKLACY